MISFRHCSVSRSCMFLSASVLILLFLTQSSNTRDVPYVARNIADTVSHTWKEAASVTRIGYPMIGYFPLQQLQAIYMSSNSTKDETKPKTSYPKCNTLVHPKRILVTGGAGFVGSHLVDRLMLQGHIVTVVDNYFTGTRNNIGHWEGHPRFEIIRHDVTIPLYIEIDEIYHMACPASPPHYQENPIKTLKTSFLGTMNMLELAKRTNAKILLTSTSEVYGDPEIHPQPESYFGNVNTIGPRACYDEGKRVAETLCIEYNRAHNVTIRIARIFNTFGPRMNPQDGRVVSNFIMAALQGEDLLIYGDGQTTRSFQFIHDLVDGLMLLMANEYSSPVNIGNPEEYSMQTFAELIINEAKSQSNIRHLAHTQDDPNRRKPDITVAKRELSWSASFGVHQGISETIHYFRQYLETMKSRQ